MTFRLVLDTQTDAGLRKPSGDVLLRSLAAHAGRGAVAVVLTGMGRDNGPHAKTDTLTGFLNHGAFHKRLEEEVARPARYGHRLRLPPSMSITSSWRR